MLLTRGVARPPPPRPAIASDMAGPQKAWMLMSIIWVRLCFQMRFHSGVVARYSCMSTLVASDGRAAMSWAGVTASVFLDMLRFCVCTDNTSVVNCRQRLVGHRGRPWTRMSRLIYVKRACIDADIKTLIARVDGIGPLALIVSPPTPRGAEYPPVSTCSTAIELPLRVSRSVLVWKVHANGADRP